MIRSTLGLFWALITPTVTMTGEASWYGREHRGNLMANGRKFDDRKMTCASWFFPIGTRLTVTNPANGNSVEVCVADRGPSWRLVFKRNRIIDLSHAAFAKIADPSLGVIPVSITHHVSHTPQDILASP